MADMSPIQSAAFATSSRTVGPDGKKRLEVKGGYAPLTDWLTREGYRRAAGSHAMNVYDALLSHADDEAT